MKKPIDDDPKDPQVKNEDSQPIGAAEWKAEEAKSEPEEVAKPKPAVRDHHAKAKHEDGKPSQHPKPKQDDPPKAAPEKVDA